MKRLVILLLTACTSTFAAEATLFVPQFQKPATKPVEGDPLQAKYDAAWTRWEQGVAKATEDMLKALDVQFGKAADAGNLELADMWDKKKKSLVDTKTLEWLTDGKTKADWRKRNPTTEFPEEFSEAFKAAQQAYSAAVDALKADYDALVKDYTRTRNLERAKQLREEIQRLVSRPVAHEPEKARVAGDTPPSERPRAKMDPPPKAALPFQLGTYDVFWVDDKNKSRTGTATFEFLPDCTVKRNGVAIGKWAVSLGVVQIVYDDPSRGKATLRALSADTFEGGQMTADKASSSWKGVRRPTK